MDLDDQPPPEFANTCCQVAVALGMMIWGSVSLAENTGARDDAWEKDHCDAQVWNYCLVVVVMYACQIINLVYSYINEKVNSCLQLTGPISLVHIVWVFVIWVNKVGNTSGSGDTPCKSYYKQTYNGLWWFYVTIFWMTVAALCLVGLSICCVFCVLAVQNQDGDGAGAGGGGGRRMSGAAGVIARQNSFQRIQAILNRQNVEAATAENTAAAQNAPAGYNTEHKVVTGDYGGGDGDQEAPPSWENKNAV